MIRVMHILPWVTGGGVERRRAFLAEAHSDVFDLRILCFAANGAVADRIRASRASFDDLGGAELLDAKMWLSVAKEIRAFKPHILHGAVFEGNIIAATLGRALGVPIVVIEETSQASNRSPRGHALFRGLSMAADAVVAISAPVADDLRTITKVTPRKVRLVTNGVEPHDVPSKELRASSRERFGLSSDDFVVGSMCRLVDDSHKRVSDLIRATALLPENSPVKLLVCGDGPVRPMLEELTDALGVRARVVFAGLVSSPEEGYAAMDVFAHVPQREGFGLVMVEAGFSALPIITTGVGGIAQIVIPEETALIVDVGAPEQIVAAIESLRKDDSLRERLGSAARARAVERFSAQRWVNDLESLYEELLTEKGLV